MNTQFVAGIVFGMGFVIIVQAIVVIVKASIERRTVERIAREVFSGVKKTSSKKRSKK